MLVVMFVLMMMLMMLIMMRMYTAIVTILFHLLNLFYCFWVQRYNIPLATWLQTTHS
jgi:hypothetical protein